MVGELVPRRGGVVRRGGALVTTGAPARSTASVSFSGELVTWDHLPAKTRRVAGRTSPVVVQGVDRDPQHRVDGSRMLEHATGWRVHEDAVVLAAVVRPVAPAPTGGTRAVGPWEHRGVRIWAATGPARRRRGVIDVADELEIARRGDSGGDSGAATPAHGRAAEAWRFLPQVVRADAERLVPTPTTWIAEITQVRSLDGFPTKQDVRSLRMSPERAVVVLATRTLTPVPGAGLAFHNAQMARLPWLVEQVGLDLADPDVRAQLRRA